ncbi:ragulator complex protein LAMTOR1-like isoform X2 [Lineus longissimus]|uniref:ragulator complex protein LAMTOR1-like isoform X2 n=1 Tax=Lineus longissimus TaxID=88925 RepID=UPI00315CFA76
MGCCWSSEKDDNYTDPSESERRHLIDPVSNNTQNSDNYAPQSYGATQKGDEQSVLNRILHQAANNVIDVSAIDAHNMEQHEYQDRVKQYKTRVEIVCSSSQRLKRGPTLPNVGVMPQNVLSEPPVSLADIQFVSMTAEKALQAVRQVKVTHKEDLVVPFGVP